MTGAMLDEALGADNSYYRRHGDHADILREQIVEALPAGWRERLVPVPDIDAAHALDPHDLAAVKLLVARPKDIALLRHLLDVSLLNRETLRQRADLLPIPLKSKPRVLAQLDALKRLP